MARVVVVEYDPQWKERFEALKERLWPAVSKWAGRIEHVGSTSVEGLSAKPVIDVDIVIPSPVELPPVIEGLAGLGYEYRGDLGIEGREAFRNNEAEFRHNLYVCLDGCLALRNHLILRDHLRNHPADRDRYSEIKRMLAAQFPDDIDSYIDGKTEFILSVLAQYDMGRDELDSIGGVNTKGSGK